MTKWHARRRRSVAAVGAILLAGAAASCSAESDAPGTQDSPSGETTTSAEAPQELVDLRLQNCVSVLQVAVAPLLIGQELGFFEEEGIGNVEAANSSGSTAQCVQLTAAGQADFTSPIPDLLFNALGQGVDPGVQCVYNLIHRPTAAFMVDPDSGITSYSDLEGQIVGVHDLSSAYIPLFEASMRAEGADPSTVEYQVSGYGAQVVDALQTNKIAAALYWDYEAAAYPAVGYTPDLLDLPDEVNQLFSSCIAFNEGVVDEQPELVAGYLRALTKSIIFAEENPDATVQLFWDIAPESKPTGMTDDEALDQARTVLSSRLMNILPAEGQADERYGTWQSADQWVNYADFLGLPEGLDVESLYTTEFIDAANDFDVDEVREFAQSYTYGE